ncbi:MAG: ornithine carbamoyltransferase [Pirellulaceae bacterium]|nr:MAG: ornithine carbamoyltransferase [Pirellulaceae bacterium]
MASLHFLSLLEQPRERLKAIVDRAGELKARWKEGHRDPLLAGRVLALLFEKPSLRTRVSFETAMAQLGGSSLFLGKEVGWGEREAVADFAQVLSQYVDAIVFRTRSHRRLVELAQHCSVPVINGLSNLAHPCQALADLFTIRELFGTFEGVKLVFVGDGNNVARSLAVGCAAFGVEFVLAGPPAYQFSARFLESLRRTYPEARCAQTDDPHAAVRGAQIVYTDVWTSMGQEDQAQQRRAAFAAYQVNRQLMQEAGPQARFMHCLPAHRGEEVTDEVIDGPASVVVHQAANRLHLQKGLLVWLLENRE